ncbi:unnamed protein product [Rhodiola kirilowii]
MDISGGWLNLSKHNGGCNYNINSTTTLRFRPIAPKPSLNGSASSSITFDEKRKKRRYLRAVNRTSRCKRKPKTTTASSSERAVLPTESKIRNDAVNTNEKQIVTLQLLPPEPVRTVSASNFADRSLAKCAESWVTVECVMGISTLSSLRTDDETKAALSRDTCPAFVSNGYTSNVVELVNDAFKSVVMDGMMTEKVAVWLEVLDGVVLFECGAAFSCRVKWRYKKGGGMVERTLLCDTWRMGSGGFAWRLDVFAALSLGMGC